MATINFENGTKVNFNGTPTQQDIEEVALKLGLKGNQAAQNSPTSNDQTQENPLFKSGQDKKDVLHPLSNMGAGVLNALSKSEQNFGKDIGQAGYLALGGQKKISTITQQYLDNGAILTTLARKQTDPSIKAHYAQMAVDMYKNATDVGGNIIGSTRTPMQIVGDALGTTMDLVLAGSYNNSAKNFQLLSSADKANLALQGVKTKIAYDALSVGDKLKFLAKGTAIATAKGAALGYGTDVAKNLQSDTTGELLPSADKFKPGFGTAIGAAVPLVIGSIKITATALKNSNNAGRVVNSLIGTRGQDLSYGKNPGKVIAEEGITGNSLEDLGSNVRERRLAIGSQLGDNATALEGKVNIDATSSSKALDDAIAEASKTPKTNKALIERLQNIKSDLFPDSMTNLSKPESYEDFLKNPSDFPLFRSEGSLSNPNGEFYSTNINGAVGYGGADSHYEFGFLPKNPKIKQPTMAEVADLVDQGIMTRTEVNKYYFDHGYDAVITGGEGARNLDIIKNKGIEISVNPEINKDFKPLKDLTNMSFKDAVDLKGTIGDLTKWTGSPSDDKIVNKALKQTYGTLNSNIMSNVQKADPQVAQNIATLNDKYGSLLTAESVIRHKDALLQGKNLISMPIKIGTVAGLIAEVASGGNPIAAILTGTSAGLLEKALSSPAFKTRIASWLANQSPTIIDGLYKANPAIRNVLLKINSST